MTDSSIEARDAKEAQIEAKKTKPKRDSSPKGQSSKVELTQGSLGVVIKSHGIRGGLRFYCNEPELAEELLEVGLKLTVQKATGERFLAKIEKLNWDNHFKNQHIVLIQLAGIEDRTAADELKNAQLIIEDFVLREVEEFTESSEAEALRKTYVDSWVSFTDSEGQAKVAKINDLYESPAHPIAVAVDDKGNSYEFPLVEGLLNFTQKNQINYSGAVLES
jgi:hypothetical protein